MSRNFGILRIFIQEKSVFLSLKPFVFMSKKSSCTPVRTVHLSKKRDAK